MGLQFCANLFFMFQEAGVVLKRYSLAANSGFKAVESAFLYEFPVDRVVAAKVKAGVRQILINVDPGDFQKGELGFAAIPGKEEKFKESLQKAITYCKALECKLIHIMAGKVENPTEENHQVYKKNLELAVSLLKEKNIVGVIEPINKISIPGYYLNDVQQGLKIVKEINSPHIRLLADLFHWKMMNVDLVASITEAFPYIGHIQVAQSPDRHEPDTPGDIDYPRIFSLLESLNYDKWIGLEYKPAGDTQAGLKWIKDMGFTL